MKELGMWNRFYESQSLGKNQTLCQDYKQKLADEQKEARAWLGGAIIIASVLLESKTR